MKNPACTQDTTGPTRARRNMPQHNPVFRLTSPKIFASIILPLLLLACLLLPGGCQRAQPAVRIAAAASLEPVLTQLAPRIQYDLHIRILIDAAASGTLARQIIAGAPADLFISANKQWMDELQKRGRILPQSRIDLLSNRLVVVARANLPNPPASLNDIAQSRFAPLALGDPAYVPAGQYAKHALQSAHLWTWAKDHSISAPNVQAALAYVQRGECPTGIVYASDVVADPSVHVLFDVPPSLYPPIVYPAAVIAQAPAAADAQRLLNYLTGPKAQAAFQNAGFKTH